MGRGKYNPERKARLEAVAAKKAKGEEDIFVDPTATVEGRWNLAAWLAKLGGEGFKLIEDWPWHARTGPEELAGFQARAAKEFPQYSNSGNSPEK